MAHNTPYSRVGLSLPKEVANEDSEMEHEGMQVSTKQRVLKKRYMEIKPDILFVQETKKNKEKTQNAKEIISKQAEFEERTAEGSAGDLWILWNPLVFGFHISILNHFKKSRLVSFPNYLFHSLECSIMSIQNCKAKMTLHQGLIALLYRALNNLPSGNAFVASSGRSPRSDQRSSAQEEDGKPRNAASKEAPVAVRRSKEE